MKGIKKLTDLEREEIEGNGRREELKDYFIKTMKEGSLIKKDNFECVGKNIK